MTQIRTPLRLTQPPEDHRPLKGTLDAERRAAALLLATKQDVRDEALNIACTLMARVAEKTVSTRDVHMSPAAPHEEESVAARIVVRPHPSLLSGMLQVVQPSLDDHAS